MTFTDRLSAGYTGEKGPLFGLAFKTALLTLITLGIYRFWAKTRIRKYIWSSIRLGDDTLEYTGTGLEKFLGFLVAVVVLAVYLGLVQLGLFYFGLHYVAEPKDNAELIMQNWVVLISFFAVVPLILFASYRARRYMLARTRLRGIRFGMDKAAWGYVWRAIGHGLLTILTLGILLPRQTYWLEKYKTDRSYFGDQRFEQGGKWTSLYPAMTYLFIGGFIACIGVGGLAQSGIFSGGGSTRGIGYPILAIFIGFLLGLVGYVYYRVHSFRYLAANKMLMNSVGFLAEPRTGRVIGTYLWGWIVIAAAFVVALLLVWMIVAVAFMSPASNGSEPAAFHFKAEGFTAILIFLFLVVIFSPITLTFITQPIIAHYTQSLTVLNPVALDAVAQRAHDAGADAEGFADALDIGAAI